MNSAGGSRRPSFCLYCPGLDSQLSTGFLQTRGNFSKGIHDGELGDAAREAKERLDERLRSQRPAEIKRHNSEILGASTVIGNVQREVYSSKRCCKKFSWSKLGWKASEQVECVVCLDNFKTGDILVHLPCAHRFHWNCAMPWLESSSQCPCCRMPVSSSN